MTRGQFWCDKCAAHVEALLGVVPCRRCKQYRDVNVMPNSKYSNSAKDKRACLDSSARSRTKACREKMRRDRLNERFMDLYSILEPGNFQNSNKVAILRYAAHLLNHLRIEAKELKDKNKFLQETIENLKEEKLELQEENLMLKAEKKRMENAVESLSIPSSFAPQFSFYPTTTRTRLSRTP
ncbi:transcription factor ILR3 isoform X3 [Jatropha curcas]|uniref:transcription factor ILR3 isoform X3 n=1 Tax=Jatropha curcas TaxID=180498 RepID=UPI0009D73B40|nr:transcription factor ILR3 isoform X3 [Jatropha curcas]